MISSVNGQLIVQRTAHRKSIAFTAIAAIMIYLTACNSVAPPSTVITEAELTVAQWDDKPDGRAWTKHAYDAIDEHGKKLITTVPRDVAKFCKSYKSLSGSDRRAFWIHLVSALARYESNYDTSVSFDETTVDKKMLTRGGKPIISRGLLQISKESANGYGCKIADASQLHDAGTNINCAIRILNRWVARDKVISGRVGGKWRGAARYFSPFRDEKKLSEMQTLSNGQAYCQ